MDHSNFWKENWALTRERFEAWWRRDGLILNIMAPRETPLLTSPSPERVRGWNSGIDAIYPLTGDEPLTIEEAWVDVERRARLAEIWLANMYFGGEAFPYMDAHIGPGSLGMFLGAKAEFDADTVWYHPCISDPDAQPPLEFDPEQHWFVKHCELLEAGLSRSAGRFLVGMPDMVENIDVLASLRGTQPLLFDMIERPEWVSRSVTEINQAFFAAFERLYDLIKDEWGGNTFSAFHIWGPGKTAKIQCDMSAMISPKMYEKFVVPALHEQCEWLDYSMYHLDGTQAMVHLDQLLAIESLDAIEWTPQAGLPEGGDPEWYDLYRRILEGGKSVQIISVKPQQVNELINAVGTHGVFIMTSAKTEAEARALAEAVEAYR